MTIGVWFELGLYHAQAVDVFGVVHKGIGKTMSEAVSKAVEYYEKWQKELEETHRRADKTAATLHELRVVTEEALEKIKGKETNESKN